MKSKAVPLYVQIAEQLRDYIKIGKWKEGEKIPTEFELCEIFDVSRITIRKAIDELVNEDLLRRERAKGTFVTSITEPSENYTIVKGFTQEMQELGEKARTMEAQIEVIKADRRLSVYLNCNIGDQVILLKRVRGDSKHIFVYTKTYFLYNEKFSLNPSDYYGSFYAYLRELGIQPTENKEVVEAILPNFEVRNALNISEYEPVLKRTRFTSCKRKNFYEYTECYYIGRSYKYFLDFQS